MVVFGREREVARCVEWLAGGHGVLVIAGPPGIGKSSVWTSALDRVDTEAFVVRSRPTASEASLAWTVLADLVRPIADHIEHLADPQRRALDAVLSRDELEHPISTGAVASAALELFSHAADGRLAIAVDDLHWVDASSAQVLSYVFRRLSQVPVLLAVRSSNVVPPALEGVPTERIELGPLDLAALHHVVRSALGEAPARPALVEIERISGGNPLLAIEMARAIGSRGGVGATADVQSVVAERSLALPEATRRALLIIAASGHRSLAALPVASDVLVPAIAAGVIVHETDDTVAFRHPLYAEAVLTLAGAARVREIHRELAEVVEDADQRARHLALGSSGPDERIATLLTETARRNHSRGAMASAAEMVEMAADFTPSARSSARLDRLLLAAEWWFHAGGTTRALALVDRALVDAIGKDRARALLLKARLHHDRDGAPQAIEAASEAAARAADEGDPELTATALTVLSRVDYEDFERAMHHAEAAVELLESLPEAPDGLRSQALLALAEARAHLGLGVDVAAFERAVALESDPTIRVADRASSSLASWMKYADDLSRSRTMLLAARAEALAEGDDVSLVYAISHLPQLELWAGEWPAARRWATEHLDLAEQMQIVGQQVQAHLNLGLVEAHYGRVDDGRAQFGAARRLATELGDDWFIASIEMSEAFLDWSMGRGEHLVTLHRDLDAVAAALDHAEPGRRRPVFDLAEALIAVGRLDDADTIIAAIERAASRVGRRSAHAAAARARSLLFGAQGFTDEADRYAIDAIDTFASIGMPFDRARALLARGVVLRRAKRRGEAAAMLDEARRAFDELGAVLWVERVEAEEARLGAKRKRDPNALTASELAVARLASHGLTVREVAERLFLSPKTVEANLTRCYRKLGINSRAELGALRDRLE